MTDLEREAFERFILSQYQVSALRPRVNNCGIVCPESYAHPKIDFAWQAWQARAQAQQWRPIEAAPRDGTEIVTLGGTDDPCHCICMWEIDRDGLGYWCSVELGCEPLTPPTHWMPIAAAPEVSHD